MKNIIKNNIVFWLLSIIFLTFIIISVGGITRLTGSGLSMVDWHPVYGILPPITLDQWNTIFEKYKLFPEYKIKNFSMTLSEFKFIFFWEYIHRILGRIIGLVIIVPYVFFLIKKKLNKELKRSGLILSIMVVIQGLIGWYMVKSGLINEPRVSHLRLALHLSGALVILQFSIWTLLSYFKSKRYTKTNLSITMFCFNTTLILGLQIIYGAFTAGLKAGYGYNSFPKMSGEWLPLTAIQMMPFVKNLIYNPVMIQFMHRMLGLLLLSCVIILVILIERSNLKSHIKVISRLIIGFTLVQYLLGIGVIIFYVPLSLAVIHQFGAVIVLSLFIILNHMLRWEYKKIN
ncbi:MAG: heme A synthase [Rickettsiales bacterium]|nr:heme A synthase [Rickettsiales bacterium]